MSGWRGDVSNHLLHQLRLEKCSKAEIELGLEVAVGEAGVISYLFSLPYDFCATLACSISTVWSAGSCRYLRTLSRSGLVWYGLDLQDRSSLVLEHQNWELPLCPS